MGGSSVALMNNHETNDCCKESSVSEKVGQTWIASHALGLLAQVSQGVPVTPYIYFRKI